MRRAIYKQQWTRVDKYLSTLEHIYISSRS